MESFWQEEKQKAKKNKQKKRCNLAARFIPEPCDPSVDKEAGTENGWMDFAMRTFGLHLSQIQT